MNIELFLTFLLILKVLSDNSDDSSSEVKFSVDVLNEIKEKNPRLLQWGTLSAYVGEINLDDFDIHLNSVMNELTKRRDYFTTTNKIGQVNENLGADVLQTWKICIDKSDSLIRAYARLVINSLIDLYHSDYSPLAKTIHIIKEKSNENRTYVINSPTIIGLDDIEEQFFKSFVEGFKDAATMWKTKNVKEFSQKAKKKIKHLKNALKALTPSINHISTSYFDRVIIAQLEYLTVCVLNSKMIINDLKLNQLLNPSVTHVSRSDVAEMHEIDFPKDANGQFLGLGRTYSKREKKLRFYLFLQQLSRKTVEKIPQEFLNSDLFEILQTIGAFTWPFVLAIMQLFKNNQVVPNMAGNELPMIAPQLNRGGDESEDDE